MTPDSPEPPASPSTWKPAAITAAIGIVLMAITGGFVAPYARLLLDAHYGIVELVVLHPFGLTLPGIATFLIVNLCILFTCLAAGRRVGALMAHRAVESQLRSMRPQAASAWIAGAVGAAAFAGSSPPAVPAGATLPTQLLHLTFGYLLYLVVLLVGPTRGAQRYLRAHPHCRRCWVWMSRETGGGSYALADIPRVKSALSQTDFVSIRDLPVAAPAGSDSSCSLQWWKCPSCQSEGKVTCIVGDPDDRPRTIYSRHIDGHALADLQDLIAHRRAIADTRPVVPAPSAAARRAH